MDSNSKNIFQQFLIEEFEKHKGKQIDVVGIKRKKFKLMLEKAEIEMRKKLFVTAAKDYFAVIKFVKFDPYPDEFDLSSDTDYLMKCCYCYCSLRSPERFADEEESSILLDIIKELNDKFRKRLFPMFLLVLLNFYRKNWLTTMTWCDEIANYMNEESTNEEEQEIFKGMLPSSEEIRLEVETFEDIAYFGYGQKLSRNALLEPRFEKYKNWSNSVNKYTNKKLNEMSSPISELQLHLLFHQDIFPIWCMSNDKDYANYYNEKFVTKCNQCMRAKLYTGVPKKEACSPEENAEFERYIDQCTAFYQKYQAQELSFETVKMQNEQTKVQVTANESKNKVKTNSSTQCQTDKIKTNNKHIQTEGVKSKNVEVQVSMDSQLLNTVMEIKTKCLVGQEKKDETIKQLNRKIQELQEKINKENITRKNVEMDVQKKVTGFKCEVQKLKEKLGEYEEKRKAIQNKNICLQKLLVEQTNDKFNTHKQHHKILEKQAIFMVTYLKELLMCLTPKSIPDDRMCRQNIEFWEQHLQNVKQSFEHLQTFYQKIRVDMINSDTYDMNWPELPYLPRFEENLVFLSFKSAIANIIQTEEKLWRPFNEPQTTQIPLPVAGITSVNKFGNILLQGPQLQPSNSFFLGPRCVYGSNVVPAPNVSIPLQSKPLQSPRKHDRQTSEPNTACNSKNTKGKIVPQQKLKQSKSMEFLNKTGDTSLTLPSSQDDKIDGACAVKKKKKSKKEKEVILLDYVLEHCSGASEEEVTLALLHLLEENKNSLSNLPKDQIVEEVKVILSMKKQTPWLTPKSPHPDWQNDHSESDCSICFETFSMHNKYTLPCQHEYHKECIKKWLKTSSVCPICRVHSVFDEEFPPLH